MDENPGFVKRQLMKVDMGVFYWIMSAFRAAVIAADFVLDLLFGVTIQYGSREGHKFPSIRQLSDYQIRRRQDDEGLQK